MDLDALRRLALARSYGMCEGCGRFGLALQVHHRQARGAGGVHGEAEERANDIRNVLALCAVACHPETEHADTWRRCEDLGWRVPKSRDPFTTPARIYTVNGHAWWILTQDAGYLWVDWPTTSDRFEPSSTRP